jgi:hypothetical protein
MRLASPSTPGYGEKAHVIPGLSTRSLLSVGKLVATDCSVTFDRTKVQVLQNHAKILEGQRDLRNGLWTVDLQDNNSQPSPNGKKGKTTSMQVDVAPRSTLNPNEAHIIYECSNKRDLVRFLHAADFSPVTDTWLKVIRAGHFATWSALTEDLVRKHLPKEITTVKGHLSQRWKNL